MSGVRDADRATDGLVLGNCDSRIDCQTRGGVEERATEMARPRTAIALSVRTTTSTSAHAGSAKPMLKRSLTNTGF